MVARIYFSFYQNTLSILESKDLISGIPLFKSFEDFELYLTDRELGGVLWRDFKTGDQNLSRKLCLAMGALFDFMPEGESLPYRPPTDFYNFDRERGEVIFFGGSFNPWHEGHMECVSQCPEKNLVVIPDYNPWKEGESRRDLPYEQFLSLCEKLKGRDVSIYPGFLGVKESNPTINWLPLVKVEKKSLLIGADNFEKFEKWKDYQLLLRELTKIYIVPRAIGLDNLRPVEKRLKEINPALEVAFLSSHDFEGVSSSEIRKR